jgi:hypothetical protein
VIKVTICCVMCSILANNSIFIIGMLSLPQLHQITLSHLFRVTDRSSKLLWQHHKQCSFSFRIFYLPIFSIYKDINT